MKWIKQLFCKHTWIKTGFTVYENGFGDKRTKDNLKCSKCGKRKKSRYRYYNKY